MKAKTNKSELKWVLLWAVVIVALSSVPYLWGLYLASAASEPGAEQYHFLGFTHNIDDGAVYLSWMRQTADGHFFIRNLFTNEPQSGRQFNLLFLVMGWFAALTHLPLALVYHIFRAGLGIALILAIWKFSKLFLRSSSERRLLIPLVGFSSGVGWLLLLIAKSAGFDWLLPHMPMPVGPVDRWQSEAFTFTSIYLNPLFIAGQMLMLGALYNLVLAQRTGKAYHAVYAGLYVLLLGNVHTYDVITVAGVWVCYVVVLGVVERRFPSRVLALSLLAAAIALPSSGYQFYLYSTDHVFRARADSHIASPALWAYFTGYGLVFIGAVIGAVLAVVMEKRELVENKYRLRHMKLLLIVWSIAGLALPYLPVGQQRKLIMGLHIPLCILCAYALAYLVRRFSGRWRSALPAMFVACTAIGTFSFVSEDVLLLSQGRTPTAYRPFMTQHQMNVMNYLRQHSSGSDTILAPPAVTLFIPAFTGRQVYYGHWSETPDNEARMNQWLEITDSSTSEGRRLSILRESGATRYIAFSETMESVAGFGDALITPPEYNSGPLFLYMLRTSNDTP